VRWASLDEVRGVKVAGRRLEDLQPGEEVVEPDARGWWIVRLLWMERTARGAGAGRIVDCQPVRSHGEAVAWYMAGIVEEMSAAHEKGQIVSDYPRGLRRIRTSRGFWGFWDTVATEEEVATEEQPPVEDLLLWYSEPDEVVARLQEQAQVSISSEVWSWQEVEGGGVEPVIEGCMVIWRGG